MCWGDRSHQSWKAIAKPSQHGDSGVQVAETHALAYGVLDKYIKILIVRIRAFAASHARTWNMQCVMQHLHLIYMHDLIQSAVPFFLFFRGKSTRVTAYIQYMLH
jgi:hypothetical protein